jgi:hypothetical protein
MTTPLSVRARHLWAPLFLATGSLLAACTSSSAPSDDTFPAAPLYKAIMSDQGKLKIDVSTAPEQPPSAGVDGVELVLTDAKTGERVDKEEISLVPFMPTMGHGTDVIPELKAMGKGRYVFTNVNLYMPGKWQLRFKFSGPVTDSAAPELQNVE